MVEAVICTSCGCEAQQMHAAAPAKRSTYGSTDSNKKTSGLWIPLVFGILSLIHAINFAMSYFFVMSPIWDPTELVGLFACPLLGIIASIKYFKSENKIYSILGLIFSCISILIKFVVIVVFYTYYNWF